MKKLLISLILFFSIGLNVFAEEVNLSFNKDFNQQTIINATKDEVIEIPLYYQANDIQFLGLLADFEYDSDHLELIDYKEESGFTVTIAKRILADRFGGSYEIEGKVTVLKFKVKSVDKTTISLKNISVANLENELTLPDINITIDSKENKSNISIYIIAGVLVVASLGIIVFKSKKKKG